MSMILHSFSLCNVVMVGIIVLLFSIKSIVEDTFLKSDQQYADYMSRVRYRWLPGVL
jgi:protein-S-isoprenylcysteine O-methyltransferase Ste14